MRLILTTEKEIKRRLLVKVNRHLSKSEDIARETVENKTALEKCRRGVVLAEQADEAFKDNVGKIDDVLSKIEQSVDNADEARAALDDWNGLIVDERFLSRSDSIDNLQPLSQEDLLEALVTEEELRHLQAHLARPSFDRHRWTKGDYIVCGACALLGLSLELLNVAWRAGSPIDPDGNIRKWFDKSFHHHAENNPIDYQGPGFGGGLHRVRTSGHDLARFFEAVRQCADGEFRGVGWSYGKPFDIISKANQYGKAYPTMDWTAAFVRTSVHLIADFFSTHSIPMPFSSVVYENAPREMRLFVHDLYKGGFNFRHVAIGGLQVLLSYLAIEVWLWLQYGFKQRKTEAVRLKRYEMRLAVMGILTSGNLAGALICQNPFQLNPPVWIATVASGVRMMQMRKKQKSEFLIQGRNIEDLAEEWGQLAAASTSTDTD